MANPTIKIQGMLFEAIPGDCNICEYFNGSCTLKDKDKENDTYCAYFEEAHAKYGIDFMLKRIVSIFEED